MILTQKPSIIHSKNIAIDIYRIQVNFVVICIASDEPLTIAILLTLLQCFNVRKFFIMYIQKYLVTVAQHKIIVIYNK